MAKHKAPRGKKARSGGGGGGSGRAAKPTRTRKTRARSNTTRKVGRGRRAGAYQFIEAPPRKDMKRKSPDSAPRLYEWLVSEGYVEPVNTGSSASRTNRRRGRK